VGKSQAIIFYKHLVQKMLTTRMIETKCAKEMLDDMHKRKIDMADEILLYRIKYPPKAKVL